LAKPLVVFIHGFLGRPQQFDRLAAFVADQGYRTETVLLHGHGGGGLAFAKSTAWAWEIGFARELEKLDCPEGLILVGHSIGGLLSLCASAERKLGFRAFAPRVLHAGGANQNQQKNS
jgi:esterase/lipase